MPNQHTSDTRARVLRLLKGRKRGLAVSEIAERLGVSRATVDSAIRRMIDQWGVPIPIRCTGLRRINGRECWTYVA